MVSLNERYSLATLLLALLTLVVVMVGAYTRLSDAGLGCPDWPGCYGSLIVPEHTIEKDKAWIEMIHRYIAGILGLCVFALTLLSFVKLKFGNPLNELKGLMSFISVLITFQALLGMWTVTKLLHPTIVMLHLLGGMATLSLIWLAHLRIRGQVALPIPYFRVKRSIKIASFIGLFILIIQIALGGWVSTNYAAFSCPDFPTCQAQWWPALDMSAFNIFIPIDRNFEGGFLDHPARVTIHFIHRVGALITGIYLAVLGFYGVYKYHGTLKKWMIALLCVLFIQIMLGITNVIALLPLWAAVLHNGVAAILLVVMVTITYRLFKVRSA